MTTYPPLPNQPTHSKTVLLFEGVQGQSLTDLGALLRDIETVYWVSIDSRSEQRFEAMGLSIPDLQPRPATIHLHNPLEVVLEIVTAIWPVGAGATFVGALAMIFKLPARYEKAREQYWRNRLAADQARRDWIEWTASAYRDSPIQLNNVALPDEAHPWLPPPEDEP
jgi:hypothetical protein